MKNSLKNKSVFLAALSLLVLYLVSTVGFGMHTCNCSKSSHLFISYAYEGCNHEKSGSCSGMSAEQDASDEAEPISLSPQECCSDSYYQIDSDQLDSRGGIFHLSLPVILRNIDFIADVTGQMHISRYDSEDLLISVDIRTFCSQWRI